MRKQDPRIEELHQQASTHYLQGEFGQALRAWRELLALSPDDERALEGVRLCEMLAEETGQASADAQAPTFEIPDPVEADRSAPPEQPGQQAAPASAPPQANLPQSPPPPPQGNPTDQGFDFDFTEIGAESAEAVPSAVIDDQARTAAANELANRTNELLTEATRAYEQGRREDAVSLIQRVFILDEGNETARSLQEIIHAETEAEREEAQAFTSDAATSAAEPQPAEPAKAEAPVPEPEPSAPDQALDLDLDGPDPVGSAFAEAVPQTDATDATDAAEPIPDGALESFDAEDQLEIDGESLLLPEPLPLPKRKKGIPKWAMIAAALTVLVGGGAFFALGFLGDEDGSAGAAGVEPAAAPDPVPELPPEVTGELPSGEPVDTAALDALLERASEAFDAGDYGAAVLAYGDAVKLDPANLEARRQLETAGDRYREQKEQLQKWEEAIESFNMGDYRTALSIFYRLPTDTDAQRLARYKRNSWYNMGVQSLHAGDCKVAREHLREAATIDAADASVNWASELASQCGNSPDRSYYRALEALGVRALDD
jgi:tetratricopeptide (TPR) repeat protein